MPGEELGFRWLHASCYELALPSGRMITIDPYVLPVWYPSFTENDYSEADIVLCTHTHFDHVMDIPILLERNHEARLYIGSHGAMAVAERFDLMFGQVCAMDPGDEVDDGGVRIRAFRGKHSRFMKRDSERVSVMATAGVREHNIENYETLNRIGSVEYTDFLITTETNLRILITGGDAKHSAQYDTARLCAPDIVIRQASNFATPEEYAAVLARYGARYALPHHHEFAPRRLGLAAEEFAHRVRLELARLGSRTEFICPEPFDWYALTSAIGKRTPANN
jgi:L-ascorbate metabolism protein UlaG (beta-lactamase superfamily)